MTAEQPEPTTAPATLPTEAVTAPKSGGKRGPQSKAVITAEVEARVRADMEAKFEEERRELQERLKAAEESALTAVPTPPVESVAPAEAVVAPPAPPQAAAEPTMQEMVAAAVKDALGGISAGSAVDPLAPGAASVDDDPATAQWTTKSPKQVSADDLNDPEGDGSVVAHVLEDGFTFIGKVWYRGEEIVVTPGTMNWDLAQINDGTGRIILQMTEDEQYDRFDKQMFRPGRWRGRNIDINDPNLTPEDRQRLIEAANKRAIRNAVPSR